MARAMIGTGTLRMAGSTAIVPLLKWIRGGAVLQPAEVSADGVVADVERHLDLPRGHPARLHLQYPQLPLRGGERPAVDGWPITVSGRHVELELSERNAEWLITTGLPAALDRARKAVPA